MKIRGRWSVPNGHEKEAWNMKWTIKTRLPFFQQFTDNLYIAPVLKGLIGERYQHCRRVEIDHVPFSDRGIILFFVKIMLEQPKTLPARIDIWVYNRNSCRLKACGVKRIIYPEKDMKNTPWRVFSHDFGASVIRLDEGWYFFTEFEVNCYNFVKKTSSVYMKEEYRPTAQINW